LAQALDMTRLPTGPVPLQTNMEIVKDLDFLPSSGYLVAAYAPNAKDRVWIWSLAADLGSRRLVISDSDVNETPRWIGNSRRFVFVKSRHGKPAMFTSDLGDTNSVARPVLDREMIAAIDPSPSPDGHRIAFCGDEGTGFDLWTVGLDGKDLRRLYAGKGGEREPSWSLDGTWLLFSTWDAGKFRIARIKPDGSGFEVVTAANDPDCRNPVSVVVEEGR
jgi:TolB protein